MAERGKSYLWQLGEDAKALMERGELAGELADFARTFEELTEVLADWPVCYLDAFTSSRYPQRPRTLLNLLTKQLPLTAPAWRPPSPTWPTMSPTDSAPWYW
ncbi:hypothetical protein M5E87_06865 [Flavonifractor plautii]|nr:hypothetical protein M5E87_06865 [Flavonifractor plautii]